MAVHSRMAILTLIRLEPDTSVPSVLPQTDAQDRTLPLVAPTDSSAAAAVLDEVCPFCGGEEAGPGTGRTRRRRQMNWTDVRPIYFHPTLKNVAFAYRYGAYMAQGHTSFVYLRVF